MEKYFEVYYDLLNNLSLQMEAALKGLSQEGADWSPGPEMNSIAVLAAHTTGSTRFLIGHFVGGMAFERDREAEFRTAGVNPILLKQNLNQTLGVVKTVLDGLTLEDLQAMRTSPRDGREQPVAWCLGHALEHFAQHTGQMQITRQLWDSQQQ